MTTHNELICIKCGYFIKSTDKYCRRCGNKLLKLEKPETEYTFSCMACSSRLDPNDQFCANCGSHKGFAIKEVILP